MTNKQALEILVKQANERKLSNKIVANGIAVSLLQQLVERDTPMLPLVFKDNIDCPKCRNYVLPPHEFCGDCGQRLDWSVLNEN